MGLIPALGRQRQVDFCEFKASLVYKFQDSQSYTKKPVSKKQTKRKLEQGVRMQLCGKMLTWV